MNEVEAAELSLRRAKDVYEAAQRKAQAAQPEPPPAPQETPALPPNQVFCDIEKVSSVEDIVAIMRIIGIRIGFDRNHPEFTKIEHLCFDEEDDFDPENKEE